MCKISCVCYHIKAPIKVFFWAEPFDTFGISNSRIMSIFFLCTEDSGRCVWRGFIYNVEWKNPQICNRFGFRVVFVPTFSKSVAETLKMRSIETRSSPAFGLRASSRSHRSHFEILYLFYTRLPNSWVEMKGLPFVGYFKVFFSCQFSIFILVSRCVANVLLLKWRNKWMIGWNGDPFWKMFMSVGSYNLSQRRS